jgi:hypothetical protein
VPVEGIVAVVLLAVGLVLLRYALYWLWDRSPITGLILLGLPMTLFGAYGVFYGVRARWQAPDQPVAMSLTEAIEQSRNKARWVSVDGIGDMQWDCDSIVYWEREQGSIKRQWMNVILADRAKSTVIDVSFQVQYTCADLRTETPELTGEISRFRDRDHQDLNTYGRLDKYQGADTYVQLCTFCEPDDTFYLGLIGGSVLVVLGLIFSVIFARHQVSLIKLRSAGHDNQRDLSDKKD